MELNWKTLSNLKDYLISDTGIIFSRTLGREVSQFESRDGYKKVTLRLGVCSRKTFSVHRLVALAFIPNPNNKPTVNHKDGDKSNNSVCNLEWATRSEQTQHAWNTGLIKDIKTRANAVIDSLGNEVICVTTGEIFRSVGEAARAYDLKVTNLSRVCKGVKGYKTAGKLANGTKLEWRYYK